MDDLTAQESLGRRGTQKTPWGLHNPGALGSHSSAASTLFIDRTQKVLLKTLGKQKVFFLPHASGRPPILTVLLPRGLPLEDKLPTAGQALPTANETHLPPAPIRPELSIPAVHALQSPLAFPLLLEDSLMSTRA